MDLTCREIVSKLLKDDDLKDVPYYCDAEIKNFINFIDLKDILNYNWAKTETVIEQNNLETYKSVTYCYNTINLTAIESEYDMEYHQFLILKTPLYYVIVAVVYAHPIIQSSNLYYKNSDASGPDLFTDKDFDYPNLLTKHLIKYYQAFLNDEYH